MTDASTSAPPPAHSFRPQSADALWRQISTPHPTVGKARHLGEALVHAGLLSTPDLAEGLQAQQEERGNGVQRPIGPSARSWWTGGRSPRTSCAA